MIDGDNWDRTGDWDRIEYLRQGEKLADNSFAMRSVFHVWARSFLM